ncbi:hypothetical protein C8F01DRAFT_1366926 [Mycena amicta]|nr:hypothetical protein C8F01DRAFT_1366926 [Mycena amicta]
MSLPLPPELTLSVLSHLPISSLATLCKTSRALNAFIQTNESTIYHNVAIRYFSVSPFTSFDDLESVLSRRAVAGAHDWKSFCKTQLRIEQSWLGKAPSSVTFHGMTGHNVHRIKDYVCFHAHCEYDNGYLVFNRRGASGEKEVWRLVDDSVGNLHAEYSPPDEAQLRAAELQNSNPAYKRKFIPWALLKPSQGHHAFRLVYPTLVAAFDRALSFWDVPSGALLQTIVYTSELENVNYVEVSRQSAENGGLAFVCDSLALRGYSRTLERCVLEIPSSQESYADNSYTFEADGQAGWINSAVLKPQRIVHQYTPASEAGHRTLLDKFRFVHVSECGAHLVALLASSRLLIIPFFQRVIDGHKTIREIALDVQVGSPQGASKYLAFENGRIGVATVTGVFIITVDFESTLHAPPPIIVTRAAWFTSSLNGLSNISCLQLGPTGVYFNSSMGNPRTGRKNENSVPGDGLTPAQNTEAMYARWLTEDDKRITERLPNGSEVVQVLDFGRFPIRRHGWPYSSVVSIDLGGIAETA